MSSPNRSDAAFGVFVFARDPVLRAGLAAVLSCGPDLVVLGARATASDLQDADEAPDVAVVESDGVRGDVTQVLRQRWRDPSIDVLIRTTTRAPTALLELVNLGAKGLIFGIAPPQELREAVRTVASGQAYLDPDLKSVLDTLASHRVKGPFGLTAMELRVLELLPAGLTNREIGLRLGLGEQTVKTHLHNAMRKLGGNGRTHTAAIAVGEGLAVTVAARPRPATFP